MQYEILKWSDIAHEFSETLIVGNGASVAVHKGFSYGSLFEAAQVHDFIKGGVAEVFQKFNTPDFELVLRRLWQAKQVNTALKIEVEEVDNAYANVREALIQTVRTVHVTYEDAREHLEPIYKFMRGFRTVVSLNYDLLVYWAAQRGNDELGSRWHFKDCFNAGSFTNDWATYRRAYGGIENPTIYCYPHGNLALGVNSEFAERNIDTKDSGGLLSTIFDEWKLGKSAPLFVCDGTSQQKLDTIVKSDYLRSVYEGPLAKVGESLVIYGWGVAAQEDHILKQMASAIPTRIAVSVHDGMQAYCAHAHRVLTQIGVKDIRFFDAASPGAWNNPAPPVAAS